MPINFNTTAAESKTIGQIVDRIFADGIQNRGSRLDWHMDLTACHCNGTPLDFDKLLAFPIEDFAHDVLRIRKHISRDNGKLRDHFLPRSAKPQAKAVKV